MSNTSELLKIISTTVLDVGIGKAIATGMEAIFPQFDAQKGTGIMAAEAAAQIALSGILAVQASRFLFDANNVDPTMGMGLVAFIWKQPNLIEKIDYLANEVAGMLGSKSAPNTAGSQPLRVENLSL